MLANESFTRELQTRLRRRSYVDSSLSPVVTDGIMGEETTEAVRQFQRSRGMEPTGIPDYETWRELVRCGEEDAARYAPADALIPVFNASVLENSGDRTLILLMQVLLVSVSEGIGFPYPIRTDGVWDEASQAALAAVQQIGGLVPTGEPDLPTWNALARIYNTEMQKRQSITGG